ncbi:response regulator [Duganella sp. FT92W]|uniref:Virulence sensor protein BvgS n=1 Tax=Pseudoduganella rivuli TaxID=2666085 RepID=A0A7X2IVB6_9BURK|nr:response regulator [Pseudoduganella rivuli]MRV76768.1 response regulator [Pseudoduganella rivuli]
MNRAHPFPILLVDDNDANLLALSGLLDGVDNLEIVTVTSGEEALRQLLRREFGLVLMDVQMPGMDGYEAATLMRANPKTRHVPIVFVTAEMDSAQFAFRGYETGAVDYLVKPIEALVLHAKVNVFATLFRQRLAIIDFERYVHQVENVLAARRIGPEGQQLRLLIVDDQPANLLALEGMLGELPNVQLVRANSGPEALRAVLRAEYAAVLLDVQMPGMDGFETAELIRANPKTATLPIIFVTAGMKGRDAQFKGYELGAVDYLIKPLEPAILMSKVRVFCDLYQQRMALEQQSSHLEILVAERTEALRRSADELTESRERYRRLLGAVTHQLFSLRPANGTLRSYGHGSGCEAVTGYPPQAFENDPTLWLTIVPEADRAQVAARAAAALDNNAISQLEHRIRCADGMPRWVRSTFVRAGTDEAPACDVLIEDIDQRRRVEEDRARLVDQLALATRAARLGIWDWNLATDELVWDERMYQMVGVAPGDLGDAHHTWLATVHPEDRALCERAKLFALEKDVPYDIEFRMCCPDGSIRHIKADGQVVRNAQGQPMRMTGIHYDITERKQAEEEMRRHRDHLLELVDERTASLLAATKTAETANRVKSEFLAKMSHELRTPLNAVIGFSQLMARTQSLSPDQQRNLEIIHRSGQHLLTLINDVLALSKIEAGGTRLDPVDTDLVRLLDEVAEMLRIRAQAAGLELLLELDGMQDGAFAVRVDSVKLRQVLINLLGNALKFTQQGSVRLHVRAHVQNGQARVAFTIRDTGVGMSPADLQRIFEPFVQVGAHTGEGGTGLGLAISRQYVELLGGELEVESELGHGSMFRFALTLPVAAHAPATPVMQGQVLGLDQSQRGRRVLVADDDRESQMLLGELLEPLGFVVAYAGDGIETLSRMNSFTPHLVLMDWRMPQLDGLATIRRIRSQADGPQPRIIMCTASAFEEQCTLALEAGADAFLRKPLNVNELYAHIENQLGLHFQRGPAPAQATGGLAPNSVAEVLREELAALPEEIRGALKEGALALDQHRLAGALAAIEQEHPDLAARLRHMTAAFRYRELWALLP